MDSINYYGEGDIIHSKEYELLNQIAIDISVMKNDFTYVKEDIAELKVDLKQGKKDIASLNSFRSNVKGALWVIVTGTTIGSGVSLIIMPLVA